MFDNAMAVEVDWTMLRQSVMLFLGVMAGAWIGGGAVGVMFDQRSKRRVREAERLWRELLTPLEVMVGSTSRALDSQRAAIYTGKVKLEELRSFVYSSSSFNRLVYDTVHAILEKKGLLLGETERAGLQELADRVKRLEGRTSLSQPRDERGRFGPRSHKPSFDDAIKSLEETL